MVAAAQGRVLLESGDLSEALDTLARACAGPTPAKPQGYIIHYWHYLALVRKGDEPAALTAIERAHEGLLAMLEDVDDEMRVRAIEDVAEHRCIVDAWSSVHPRTVRFRLPLAAAPTGRPLHDGEWVDVDWTVELPQDRQMAGKVERRRSQLMRMLDEARAQQAAPTVGHLAVALRVSKATLRRDLAALREGGNHVVTRGTKGVSGL